MTFEELETAAREVCEELRASLVRHGIAFDGMLIVDVFDAAVVDDHKRVAQVLGRRDGEYFRTITLGEYPHGYLKLYRDVPPSECAEIRARIEAALRGEAASCL